MINFLSIQSLRHRVAVLGVSAALAAMTGSACAQILVLPRVAVVGESAALPVVDSEWVQRMLAQAARKNTLPDSGSAARQTSESEPAQSAGINTGAAANAAQAKAQGEQP